MSDRESSFRLARSELNFYADSGLDRVSELRRDAGWLAQRLQDPASRFVPLWRSRNLVAKTEARPILCARDACVTLLERDSEPVFLGVAAERAYFAVDLSHHEAGEDGAALALQFESDATFLDLRLVGPRLARHEGGLLAYARGMLTWHRRHRFCGQCGAPTASVEGGHLRRCAAAGCALEQFPRTDPAVIMLVTHGDRCLLGRHPRFPPGMYSTLAGFVEPGETLEAAVAREIWEEAGVRVHNVRYHSSQPWPFPTSLMLGFYAAAESLDHAINKNELEGGGWYERGWLIAQAREFDQGDAPFRLPRADSIARRLIEDWLQESRIG